MGRYVTNKDLGFFDADPAFNHKIDISHPTPPISLTGYISFAKR
jgi:hypothetical protein